MAAQQRSFSFLAVLMAATATFGQGTMYFVSDWSGNSHGSATATFSLTTNYFSYDVFVPYGLDQGQVRGPWPDTNAGSVFDLTLRFCEAPGPQPGGGPGFCEFRGSTTLTDQQITDLNGGMWYAFASGGNPPGSFFIQGQIVAAPEPSSWRLALIGLMSFHLLRSRKNNTLT